MKRTRLLLSAAALSASFSLWRQQTQLDQQQSRLQAQIAETRAVLNPSRKSPLPAGRKGDGVPGELSDKIGSGDAAPLPMEEFVDLVSEITRMETSIPPGGDREPMRLKITELFNRLAATPVDQLKAILERIPSLEFSADGKDQIGSAIMTLLAKSDPPAAAAYALQGKAKAGALETAVRSWARMDPAAAARWLDEAEAGQKLPPNVSAGQLRLILLPQLLAADPAGAAADQIARVQPANLGDLFAETARLLNTPAQRRTLLSRLAAVPGLPPEAIGQFLNQVGRESSVQAATDLLREVGPTLPAEQFNQIAAATATARIDAGTPAQADWLLKNLRGPDREPAISRLIRAWTEADFNAAGTWLRNQPPSADHDTAIAAFAPMVAGKEPPSAVDWALTIADATRKADVLGNIYRTWSSREPAQAAAYFQEKGLTPPAL